MTVLAEIPFAVNATDLAAHLRLRSGSEHFDVLQRLVEQAGDVARPKALYRVACIDDRTDDQVVIEGVTFRSRVLSVNLEKVHRVFPYLVTCGVELEAWSRGIEDMLHSYWADAIKEAALRSARQALVNHLRETYRLGTTSTMSPGSLAHWPIQQQRPLFALLGDTEKAIGVRLLDSMLMVPAKTVSGIRFPTEEHFESCQLCPREVCPGRRAAYEPDLYERKYGES